MWRVTADNGLPRCQGYRWVRFGLLGSSFGGGLAVSGRGGATCLPLSGGGSGLGGEGQLLAGSQHPGDGGPDVEIQRLEQQVDSHPWVADGRGATVGVVLVLELRVQRLGHGAQRDHAIEGGGAFGVQPKVLGPVEFSVLVFVGGVEPEPERGGVQFRVDSG